MRRDGTARRSAFMALLAIVATIFSLLLIEASNLLGFLIPPVVIAGAGFCSGSSSGRSAGSRCRDIPVAIARPQHHGALY